MFLALYEHCHTGINDIHQNRLSSHLLHRPKLIKPCRKTLTHHLPSHPPIRVARHAGCTQRSLSPPPINLVQHSHDPGRIGRLGNHEQVIRVLSLLTKIQQQHFGFAELETWTIHPPKGLHRYLGQQPQVVSGMGSSPVRSCRHTARSSRRTARSRAA